MPFRAPPGWVEVTFHLQPPVTRVPHVYVQNPFAPNTPNPVLTYIPKAHWRLVQALAPESPEAGQAQLDLLLHDYTVDALLCVQAAGANGALRALWLARRAALYGP